MSDEAIKVDPIEGIETGGETNTVMKLAIYPETDPRTGMKGRVAMDVKDLPTEVFWVEPGVAEKIAHSIIVAAALARKIGEGVEIGEVLKLDKNGEPEIERIGEVVIPKVKES